jgi:hypothetical protein
LKEDHSSFAPEHHDLYPSSSRLHAVTPADVAFPMHLAVILMIVGVAAAFTAFTFLMRLSEGRGVVVPAVSLICLVWGLVWTLQTTSAGLNEELKAYALATWGLSVSDQAATEVRESVADEAVTVSTTRGEVLMDVTFTFKSGHLVAYMADPAVLGR